MYDYPCHDKMGPAHKAQWRVMRMTPMGNDMIEVCHYHLGVEHDANDTVIEAVVPLAQDPHGNYRSR